MTSRLRRGAALLAPAVAIAAAADEPDLAHQYDVLEGQVRLVEQGYSRTDDSQAQRAASLITESHLAMKGWGAVEQAAGRRQGKPIGPNAAFAAARDLHVKNEWTRKIQESLARYRPKEYPILKDAKRRMLLEDVSPAPLADSPEPRKRPGPEPVASQIHD